MGGDFDKRLSNLVIDITCPALILSSTMGGTLPSREMILPLLGISLVTYILLAIVALVLPRYIARKKEDQGVVGFALMFGNVGFIGYPVVASIFGHQAVFYAAVLNVVNTFAVFTIGTMLVMGGRGEYRFQKKVLWSTPMLAAYLAMLIVAFDIDDVPRVVSQPLTMIGAITVPAALLIIGSSLSHLSARTMLGNRTVYVTSLFRLGLLPMGLHSLFTESIVLLLTVGSVHQHHCDCHARGYLRHHPLPEVWARHHPDNGGNLHHHPAVGAHHTPDSTTFLVKSEQ